MSDGQADGKQHVKTCEHENQQVNDLNEVPVGRRGGFDRMRTDGQIDSQIGRQADRQTGRQIDRLVGRKTY